MTKAKGNARRLQTPISRHHEIALGFSNEPDEIVRFSLEKPQRFLDRISILARAANPRTYRKALAEHLLELGIAEYERRLAVRPEGE